MNDLTPMDQAAEREHEEKTKIKNVEVSSLGDSSSSLSSFVNLNMSL